MNTPTQENREIRRLREVAYDAKLGRARKVARERFDAALQLAVDWDIPRRAIRDGSSTRFSAYGSVEEGGRTYRVAVYEYAGGRVEASLWLLDGKSRQDQGDHVKPHLRAAAIARYLEGRAAAARPAPTPAAAEPEISAEDREEVMYERWLLADGPAKATAEHKQLARAALAELEAAGWSTLSAELKREAFCDVATLEAVVRRGDRLALIKWHTFNRGWMEKGRYGSTIFDPARKA